MIISAFKRALADALQIIHDVSIPIDLGDDKAMHQLVQSSIGTKFVSRWSELMCGLALTAVRTVAREIGNGKMEVDVKRYARIEKIPGGEIEDSKVLDGVLLNKDITHPKMRRRIENPRIVLLDCTLEYKKGESQTNIEISKEEDWNKILEMEETQVKAMCDAILAVKPDLVITEKGVSGGFYVAWSDGHCDARVLIPLFPRFGPASLNEGKCHRPPPCQENRQQPYFARYWCDYR